MSSISRTYRPQVFSEITGQEPIKETLRLEAASGKIAHAYLFAGPRGVGKTTLARIFAKALNCTNPKDGEPCDVCDSCRDIGSGRSLDFIEMDAASNTGVDNIREAIVEHVRFVPHAKKFKIYVLDEAHMLSVSAWNALLKTIEEPPPYAVFIFVTTELHKVPQTIQSRCQRFDFKRVSEDDLAKKLKLIAGKESVELDDTVVASIISRSDGSVRDAETILGQLISLGEKKINLELANLVMPISRLPLAAQMLETWSRRKLEDALGVVAETEEQGIQLVPLFDDLIQSIRQLLLAADSEKWMNKLANGDEGEKKIASLKGVFQPAELSDMALMLMERRRDAKQGADPKFCLELAAAAVALRLLPNSPKDGGTKAEDDKPKQPPPPTPSAPSEKTTKTEKTADETSPETSKPKQAEEMSEHEAGKGVSLSAGQSLAKWAALIKAVDGISPSLTFILKISRPLYVQDSLMTISFQYPFHKEKMLGDIKTKRLLEDCLRKVYGIEDLRAEGVIGAAIKDGEDKKADTVSDLISAFGGQVVSESGA
ncbi:MAG: DNA polymerase III subunit gamma/tau [Patescibacteria group bacterium]|nr:DNA polymerase III subunit gamma/tau [Patescibacteria group bacterium]